MKPDRHKGGVPRLFLKFLAVFGTVFVITAAVGLTVVARHVESTARANLATRMGGHIAKVIGALPSAGDAATAPDSLTTLLYDPAILCAELREPATGAMTLSAPRGLGCKGQDGAELLSLPVGRDGARRLDVRYSLEEVSQARAAYGEFALGILLAGLAIAGLAGYMAFRAVVGRRLGALQRGIGAFERTGEPVRVAGGGADELRTVIEAYNRMQESLAAQAAAARRHAGDLADAKTRIEDLHTQTIGFLASMSHQLRTPLASINGYCDLIAREVHGGLGHPEYREYTRFMSEAGQGLMRLVEDVLDYTRLESGQQTVNSEPLDVRAVLDMCVRIAKARPGAAAIDFATNYPARLPRLDADERIVVKMMRHLLSNAVNFTRDGGSVTVAARRARGGLDITVSDTGIGMCAADVAVALSPFGRVGTAMGRVQDGTGLGLALVQRFAALHGASISITGEVGKGTSVTCHFPKERIAPVRRTRTAAARQAMPAHSDVPSAA